MTLHQVNLYKAEFRMRRQLLSFSQILAGWVAVMLFGLASSVAITYFSQLQAGAILLAHQQNSSLLQSIEMLTRDIENRSGDDALERSNDAIKLRIQKSSELVRFLDSRQVSFDGTGSLSAVMTGLARQSGEGIWLDGIDLVDAGLTLSGFVDTPARLPEYLKRLGQEPALTGRHFDNFSVMAVAEERGNRLAFRLSTAPKPVPNEVAER